MYDICKKESLALDAYTSDFNELTLTRILYSTLQHLNLRIVQINMNVLYSN
jgi:hypothetical protein